MLNGAGLDRVDAQLLELLQASGRLTVTELAQAVNLSRPRVADRLRRLQAKGVITRFTAVVPPAAVGHAVVAIIQISELRETCAAFERIVQEIPSVLECHRVTGAMSYVMKAVVPDMGALEALVDALIRHGRVNTAVVLSSPVVQRPISVPGYEPGAFQHGRLASSIP